MSFAVPTTLKSLDANNPLPAICGKGLVTTISLQGNPDFVRFNSTDESMILVEPHAFSKIGNYTFSIVRNGFGITSTTAL